MNLDGYQHAAESTEASPFFAMLKRGLGNRQNVRLVHALLGLASESGEIADTLKKYLFYGQELDTKNIEEELGDLMWYVAMACNALDMKLSVVMTKNLRKLKARYPERYTDADSAEKNRNRKAEREAMERENTEECQ